MFLATALLPASCDIIKQVEDAVGTCTDVCTKIQDCGVTPPTPEFGTLGGGSSGQGGVDCAASCSAEDRELKGYSDCQIECVNGSECGEIEDCWKPKSDLYAQFCLADRDIPPVEPPPEDPEPSNGTNTGNEDVDDIVEDPSVAIAVDEAADDGFELNFGDTPPRLVGKFDVSGQIDESSNARPPGSPIQTSICFWDYAEEPGGIYLSYCEDNVPGTSRAPLTGSEDGSFTAYFEYPGQATVLFSGNYDETTQTASDVEALVVYTYTTDVWELSHTDWQRTGDCDSCN